MRYHSIHLTCRPIGLWIWPLFTMLVHGLSGQIVGKVETYQEFQSNYVHSRRVDIWLPANYTPKAEYSVLYCQDGQNLFDTISNFRHREWKMDETGQRLLDEGKIRDFIIVGIWSIPEYRHAEYFPEKVVTNLPEVFADSLQILMKQRHPHADLDTLLGDEYLKFIVSELKPFVDSVYSTREDRKNTFVMGSSSGGLCAMYAVCEYPHIFGGAACLSTHFTGVFRQENNPFPAGVLHYFSDHNPRGRRIYFDTGDQGLDALYIPHFNELGRICRRPFWRRKWRELKFFSGADHNEESWASRLEIPLVYLLGKNQGY